jgi:hypothetical protein
MGDKREGGERTERETKKQQAREKVRKSSERTERERKRKNRDSEREREKKKCERVTQMKEGIKE